MGIIHQDYCKLEDDEYREIERQVQGCLDCPVSDINNETVRVNQGVLSQFDV